MDSSVILVFGICLYVVRYFDVPMFPNLPHVHHMMITIGVWTFCFGFKSTILVSWFCYIFCTFYVYFGLSINLFLWMPCAVCYLWGVLVSQFCYWKSVSLLFCCIMILGVALWLWVKAYIYFDYWWSSKSVSRQMWGR